MKRNMPVVFALVVVLELLVVGFAAASANRTLFTATLERTSWSPDFRWWLSGPNWHLREFSMLATLTATDPRISGTMAATVAANYKPSPGFMAQGNGQIRIENSAGYWKGTMVLDRAADGTENHFYTLRGYGDYDGLQARMWGRNLDPDADIERAGFEGVIFDPGGD